MEKLRVFTAFSGYDSQMMALDRLNINYDCVGWSEIDRYAIEAHNALYPQYKDRNLGDISQINWINVPDFDLFTYSSPCQDFSNAGLQMGGEKNSGTRSSLLWECEKAIREKRPKYLLMENVAALVEKKFIKLFNKWQFTLEEIGYNNYARVLNAKDYGVPQNRKRVFVVSIRKDLDETFYFPQSFRLEKRLKDILEPQVDKQFYLSDKLINFFNKNSEMNKSCGNGFRFKPQNGNNVAFSVTTHAGNRMDDNFIIEPICLNSKVDEKQPSVQDRIYDINAIFPALTTGFHPSIFEPVNIIGSMQKNSFRGSINGYAPCITSACGMGGGQTPMITYSNFRIRKLTPRECFRLMDVSESDINILLSSGISNSQLYKLAGNSIVVSCLYQIFRKLFIDKNSDNSELKLF